MKLYLVCMSVGRSVLKLNDKSLPLDLLVHDLTYNILLQSCMTILNKLPNNYNTNHGNDRMLLLPLLLQN